MCVNCLELQHFANTARKGIRRKRKWIREQMGVVYRSLEGIWKPTDRFASDVETTRSGEIITFEAARGDSSCFGLVASLLQEADEIRLAHRSPQQVTLRIVASHIA